MTDRRRALEVLRRIERSSSILSVAKDLWFDR